MTRTTRQTEDPQEALARWLAAEELGDEPAAEAALGVAFRVLSAPGPGPQFAERVLARLERPLPASEVESSLRWLVLAAASLGFFSALFFVVRPLLEPLLVAFGIEDLSLDSWPGIAAGVVSLGTQLLASVLDVWQLLAKLSEQLSQALQSPALAAVAALSVLLAAASVFFLSRLLGTRSDWRYASS